MTINEMFDELENKVRDTYIVTLKYKYDFEENYTIENQILEYDSVDDSYAWLNDWFEGQTDAEVLGYMLLGDVDTTKLLTCEDCVKREPIQKAIKDILGWINSGNRGNADYFIVDQIEEIIAELDINNLPPVTPQPKIGEWVKTFEPNEAEPFILWECSNCHKTVRGSMKSDYCPNCGADMRGDKNDE